MLTCDTAALTQLLANRSAECTYLSAYTGVQGWPTLLTAWPGPRQPGPQVMRNTLDGRGKTLARDRQSEGALLSRTNSIGVAHYIPERRIFRLFLLWNYDPVCLKRSIECEFSSP